MKAPRLLLSQRLFLLTAAALLPAVAILGFNEVSLRQSRAEELHTYAARLAEQASLEMERIVTGAAALMVAIASAPPVQQQEEEGCAAYLRQLQRTLPQVSILTVADLEGQVVCSSGSGAAGEELVAETSDVISVLQGGAFFSVGHHVDLGRSAGLSLGTQVMDDAGALSGYVLATVSLDYLGEIVRERSYSAGSALTIADRNGIILAREPLPEQFVGTSIQERFVHLVTASESGTMEMVSQDGTRRILGYEPASGGLGLYISAGVSVEEAFAPINQAFYRGLGFSLAGAILAFALAWGFGRSFIQLPFNRLLNTIDHWRGGDRTARTNMQTGATEFHRLGMAIDDMLDEIGERQIAQEKAEAHRDLLARELNHRVKNLLATVQALARQTFKSPMPEGEKVEVFTGRLRVLADAHNLLVDQQEESADLEGTLRVAVTPFEESESARFHLAGPSLILKPKAALSLALAVHELCTNAAKYGALSNDVGSVDITWMLPGDDQLVIEWSERAGPTVTEPSRTGFGSQLISRSMHADLAAEVEYLYAPAGLKCTIRASATQALVMPEAFDTPTASGPRQGNPQEASL
ncbi:sensor histidine kinase [Devosia sp. RR2S18]|uniref:sensor histidine kinase n=1 Tax=Devosia rhizosphaerae TaxID=3049774 RepID=UPI00253F7AF3|nr:sensor histidine kinase [Devosia sp. RR2S18]WIJ26403.1 sensor histidine kinase [Devosia sp. RR2S18]